MRSSSPYPYPFSAKNKTLTKQPVDNNLKKKGIYNNIEEKRHTWTRFKK